VSLFLDSTSTFISSTLCLTAAAQAINRANIIVYNYQYMLDPKVCNLVSRELEQESIVVFDEAHNIDNVCIEALSVTIDKRGLESSSRCRQPPHSSSLHFSLTE
jgi:Rad3-related DNA helicase